MSKLPRTVDWGQDGEVVMIDQTLLPNELRLVAYRDYREVAAAIRDMIVRGAPAIGAAAALGMALAAYRSGAASGSMFEREMVRAAELLRSTRPTAVNLFWAIDRLLRVARLQANKEPFDLTRARTALRDEALAVLEEDVASNKRLGAYGAALLPQRCRVLTHCNAGALACVGYGTALGVIRAAVEAGKEIAVYADETRPRLQGMKLTAWELAQDGIPVTTICDNSAGYLMQMGMIDCVVVGADRIAANGDTANKIGTYSVAVLARAHGIPFYVAAPLSTVDFSLSSGKGIPIEERGSEEVTVIGRDRIAPEGATVLNYAFDVTPAEYISAIITDKGVVKGSYRDGLASLK